MIPPKPHTTPPAPIFRAKTTTTTTTTKPVWKHLAVGAKVDAQWGTGDKWFAGKIADVNKVDKTYAVKYDDGDYDKKRKPEQVRNDHAVCVGSESGYT